MEDQRVKKAADLIRERLKAIADERLQLADALKHLERAA